MKLSREELIKRLKEISQDQTHYEMSRGAMCYSTSMEPRPKFNCDSCGKELWCRLSKSSYNSIYDIVKQIKALGYDAKAENLCLDCMLKKLSTGEYVATFKDFEYAEFVRDSWDEDLGKTVRNDLTDEEIVKRLRRNFPNMVYVCFCFRLNEDEPYHMAQSNTPYDYHSVLNFLKDHRSYLGYYDETILLRNRIEDIEKLTGITLAKKP